MRRRDDLGAGPTTTLYNPATGTGIITFHQTFLGGTFALYADPAVGWGDRARARSTRPASSARSS